MEAEAGGSSRRSRRQAPRSSLPSPPPISTQRVNTFNPLEGSPFVSNGTDDAIMRVVGVASDGGDKDGDDELHLGSKGDNAEIENKEGGIACQVSRRGNTPTAVLPLQTESEARLAGSLIQLVVDQTTQGTDDEVQQYLSTPAASCSYISVLDQDFGKIFGARPSC